MMRLSLGLFGIGVAVSVGAQSVNPPAGVDTWCGKAYRSTDSSFQPGGWLDPPPRSEAPLLNLQAYPRFNIYLEDETQTSLIVDAKVNHEVGVPVCESVSTLDSGWTIEITRLGDQKSDVTTAHIPENSIANTIPLYIGDLKPRFEPYELHVSLTIAECSQSISAKTLIYRLPPRTDEGSITKLDYLYGGLHVQNGTSWKPIFPYSFYVSWGGYLINDSHQDAFAASDFNIVHPIPGGGDEPFEPDLFAAYVEKLDTVDQYLMYDMRWTYKNGPLVTSQVNALKKHKSILLWYTVDEPDGHGDALDAPLQAYDLIKELDPYHPVSLVLNCANFHYAEYTRGTDIILTDPYPVAVDTSWSSQWDTLCNATYGCCGCDNCKGNFRDVSERIDGLKKYQQWLSNAPLGRQASHPGRSPGGPKSIWGVPQVFGGSEYWQRPPTAEEEIVMVWLFINHGAKGIVGWTFPTTPELTSAAAAMAKLVTTDEVTGLLLGDNPRTLDVEADEGVDIDAVAWIVETKMLVSVVYLGTENTSSPITIKLPSDVKTETIRQIWPGSDTAFWKSQDSTVGEAEFRVQDEGWSWFDDKPVPSWHIKGSHAKRIGLPAMSVSVMIMDIN